MGDPRVVGSTTDTIEAVFREHAPRLCRSLLLYTGDRELAGDAVAEAFAQAIRRGEEHLRSPLAWITATAYKLAARELSAQRVTPPPIVVDEGREMPEPALDLIAALATLSPKQRAATILHHYEGYTKAETAAIIGSTASAVGVHLFRARGRLGRLLEERDD